MPGARGYNERSIRERAYFIWEREGRPEGRDRHHWLSALRQEQSEGHQPADEFAEEEKVLAGRPDADMPALLTKDVRGG
jgi:hypothetical protein